jgi:lipoprotein NlpD
VNAGRKSRRVRGASAAVLLCAALLCVAQLAGCVSQSTSVPVSRREARAAIHVVQAGETLSTIARYRRVDAGELAAWNGITDPGSLRIGQRLRLVPPRGYVALPPAAVSPRSEPSSARQPPPTPTRSTRPQARTQPPRTSASTPSPRAATPPARASAPPPRQSAPPVAAVPPRWSWPTDGRVVSKFGSDIASGVGIGGREGQPIRAAADGRVVYAGGGLIGYGQLVIIKHDEMFLSAYGHNAELLVTQGQEVQRGATIALMGQGPNRQPRLHFEIRRNGVPVDPLLFVQVPR